MKLLLDQNLSRNLPARLAQVFPESTHVRMIRFDQASDEGIWNYAKEMVIASSRGMLILLSEADCTARHQKLFGCVVATNHRCKPNGHCWKMPN